MTQDTNTPHNSRNRSALKGEAKMSQRLMQKRRNPIKEGELAYQNWQDSLMTNPETSAIYKEETAKKELWLQLVEARQAAGLTQAQLAQRLGVSQAQVARIEKCGYDTYTLTSLRKYVEALGRSLEIAVV